jgi:predicted Zn-dependent protease
LLLTAAVGFSTPRFMAALVLGSAMRWRPALALVLLLGACAINPVTGKRDLVMMTEAEEIRRGREYFPFALQQSGGVYRDAELNAYINEVGQRLAAVSHRPALAYEFRVANTSTINAYALPGGPIAIHRGLLIALQNEAQLAAVLGHEIGHVAARHSVRAVTRSALANLGLLGLGLAAASVGIDPSTAMVFGQIPGALVLTHFTREDEREADRLGIQYMVRAGYDPAGAVQLHEIFMKQANRQASGWLEGLFRTHPHSRERYEAAQAEAERLRAEGNGRPLKADRFAARTARLRERHQVYLLADEAERLLGRGMSQEAETKFREAIARDPRQAPFWTGLGAARLKRGDLPGAEETLRRAVSLDDEQFRAHYYLGVIASRQQVYGTAIEALGRSIELLPTRQAVYQKAVAHDALGQDAVAAAYYRSVLMATDGDELAHEARQRLEPIQLRLTPWELVSVTSVSWQHNPTSRQIVHTVRVTNRSSRIVAFPRLRVEYAGRKGRTLGNEEAVLALTLRPGESVTVQGVGNWEVASEVHQVSMQVVAIATPR